MGYAARVEQVSPKPALAARSLPTPRTRGEPIFSLALGALGVVFGDIGTSPLYTLRECMHAVGGERASVTDLFGILSLIFWSLTMVVTVKYLAFVMRAANHGEGGIFALLAILPENMRTHPSRTLPPTAAGEGAPTSHVARRSPARLTWVDASVVIGAMRSVD